MKPDRSTFTPPVATLTRSRWGRSPSALPLRFPEYRVIVIALLSSPLGVAIAISQFNLALPLPPCLFQAVFGFPAPSCGLTRSFLALAHGDWPTALEYHLFGPVLVVLFALGAIAALVELVTRHSLIKLYYRWLSPQVGWGFFSLFLIYYAIRLWVRYMSPTLPFGLADTSLWQHFVAGALAL